MTPLSPGSVRLGGFTPTGSTQAGSVSFVMPAASSTGEPQVVRTNTGGVSGYPYPRRLTPTDLASVIYEAEPMVTPVGSLVMPPGLEGVKIKNTFIEGYADEADAAEEVGSQTCPIMRFRPMKKTVTSTVQAVAPAPSMPAPMLSPVRRPTASAMPVMPAPTMPAPSLGAAPAMPLAPVTLPAPALAPLMVAAAQSPVATARSPLVVSSFTAPAMISPKRAPAPAPPMIVRQPPTPKPAVRTQAPAQPVPMMVQPVSQPQTVAPSSKTVSSRLSPADINKSIQLLPSQQEHIRIKNTFIDFCDDKEEDEAGFMSCPVTRFRNFRKVSNSNMDSHEQATAPAPPSSSPSMAPSSSPMMVQLQPQPQVVSPSMQITSARVAQGRVQQQSAVPVMVPGQAPMPSQQVMPLGIRTPQLSVGAALHGTGTCKPCAWFWKPQGCANMQNCQHCHMCPEGELKNRKKAKVQALRSTGEDEVNVATVPSMQAPYPTGMLPKRLS